MSSDLESVLRRLKPERHRTRLGRRADAELSFLSGSSEKHGKLLFDTTVYIDILQGRFPSDAERMLRAAEAWHSTVTESELASLCGLIDPAHPGSRQIVARITNMVVRRPGHRTVAPDREIWTEAGVLSGILARLQQYRGSEQRRVLNDALIFCSARKYGLSVLTRNIADFDMLQQLDGRGRVLFY